MALAAYPPWHVLLWDALASGDSARFLRSTKSIDKGDAVGSVVMAAVGTRLKEGSSDGLEVGLGVGLKEGDLVGLFGAAHP